MTVEKNICFGMKMQKVSAARQKERTEEANAFNAVT